MIFWGKEQYFSHHCAKSLVSCLENQMNWKHIFMQNNHWTVEWPCLLYLKEWGWILKYMRLNKYWTMLHPLYSAQCLPHRKCTVNLFWADELPNEWMREHDRIGKWVMKWTWRAVRKPLYPQVPHPPAWRSVLPRKTRIPVTTNVSNYVLTLHILGFFSLENYESEIFHIV